MRSDRDVQHAVLEEFRWDSRIEETAVGVEVDQGVVTLTGIVDSYAKRLAAQEAAHRVAGVLDVANDLIVKPLSDHERSDTEIAQAVRRALEWNVFVPDEKIQSTVSNGWVTLAGTVADARERDDTEAAVRQLLGVRGVTNTITISPPKVRAGDVREEIREALERRADRLADRIQVTVEDGRIILHGKVRSWAEKIAVLGAARYTTGVHAVEDYLQIDPAA
ncbi:MAG: BON domain-containing protein [Chloroflexi bacterium]|nr:BON domain-containing protein [Chloroflexota bacterium]